MLNFGGVGFRCTSSQQRPRSWKVSVCNFKTFNFSEVRTAILNSFWPLRPPNGGRKPLPCTGIRLGQQYAHTGVDLEDTDLGNGKLNVLKRDKTA